MKAVDTKSQILEDAGYAYGFDHAVYFNRKARKVFSVEFIEDHSEAELQERIREDTQGEWRFYFNSPPAEAVKRELESVIG